MGFEIRKLSAEDRESFLCMSEKFYASDAVLHPVPAENHSRLFDELMRSEDYARGYMIEWEGERAGYALLSLSYSREAGGMCIWIEEIFILPPFQGRGAARFFFSWLEEQLPAARYRLETEPDNHRAKKLYRSLGYRELGYEQFVKEDARP